MALTDAVVGNYAQETTITTGTGTYNLDGVSSTTFQTIVQAQAEVTGDGTGPWSDVLYHVTDGIDHEIGIGTLTDGSPDTLSRLTIIESTNSGAKVNWVGGPKTVIHGPAGQWLNSFWQHLVAAGQILNVTTGTRYTNLTTALAALTDGDALYIGGGTWTGAFTITAADVVVYMMGHPLFHSTITGSALKLDTTALRTSIIGPFSVSTVSGGALTSDGLALIGNGQYVQQVTVEQSDDYGVQIAAPNCVVEHVYKDTAGTVDSDLVNLTNSADNARIMIHAPLAGTITGDDVSIDSGCIEAFITILVPAPSITDAGTRTRIVGTVVNNLLDNDLDTGIEVERTADDDIINMKVAGADAFKIDALGHRTLPLNSSVNATPTLATDVTGDDTLYTMVWSVERYDINSDLSGTTFTAPVSGRYSIAGYVIFRGVAGDHTRGNLNVVTTNKSFDIFHGNLANMRDVGVSDVSLPFSVITDMDASDTLTITVRGANGSLVIDIINGVLSIELIG